MIRIGISQQTTWRLTIILPDNLRKLDVRYFMIKSFNQENVQMAQQDVMKHPARMRISDD